MATHGDIAEIDDCPTDILRHTRYGVDQQLAATDEHRMYQPSTWRQMTVSSSHQHDSVSDAKGLTRRIHPGGILIITSAQPVDDVIRIVATNLSHCHQA